MQIKDSFKIVECFDKEKWEILEENYNSNILQTWEFGNFKNKNIFVKTKRYTIFDINEKIVGFLNQKQLSEYYSMGDLLVMTSDYETWGLTINEAMASNMPVICSNKCGAHIDMIENYKTGFTYPCGNILNLYKKLNLIF